MIPQIFSANLAVRAGKAKFFLLYRQTITFSSFPKASLTCCNSNSYTSGEDFGTAIA